MRDGGDVRERDVFRTGGERILRPLHHSVFKTCGRLDSNALFVSDDHCPFVSQLLFIDCFSHSTQPLPRSIRNRNQKFDKNITKRGNVPVGKAGEHEDDYPVSKGLIAFFLFLIVGSSVVQVLNLFRKGPALEE